MSRTAPVRTPVLSPHRPWLWLLVGLICFALSRGLDALAFTDAGDALRNFAAILSGLLSRCFSFSHRPVGEWLLIGVALGIPGLLLWAAIRHKARGFFLWLCRCIAFGCAVLLLFTAAFGLQYTGPDLTTALQLPTGRYTAEQMNDTLNILAREINRVAPAVPRTSDGECDFGSFASQADAVMTAFAQLETRVPTLASTSNVPPKETLLLGVPMSYWGITGFFFPWTGECVVSSNNPTVQQPFTIAHESAHSRRVGKEDEANFAAFLACAESEDVRLRYSALHHAWLYVWNACYATDPDTALAHRDALCEQARFDLVSVTRHWGQYEGWLEKLGTWVNDTYIKGTGQPDGVVAYSKAADLIIAYMHSDMNIFD